MGIFGVSVINFKFALDVFGVNKTNMKSKAAPRRAYRQGARAEAAEATHARILDAFIRRLGDSLMDDITLDLLASDAGVTVQTVVRRFGGKTGLVLAMRDRMEKDIDRRRTVLPGKIDEALALLAADYEEIGDLIMHLLAQEERSPEVRSFTDYGRAKHREWLAATMDPFLKKLPAGERQSRLDLLVVATDVYTWKLLRRDAKRPVADYVASMRRVVDCALSAKAARSS